MAAKPITEYCPHGKVNMQLVGLFTILPLFFEQGEKFEIPRAWIDATLAGLNRVNPFIKKLQHLKASNRNDNIALQIEQSDTNTREIAAIISLAPASPPSRRKLVIQRKGNDKPIYLDILSPFV